MILSSGARATVRERSWIPIKKNRSEKPSAGSLARLFEDDEALQRRIVDEAPSRFLNRIGVGISDIIRRITAKDELSIQKLDKAVAILYIATSSNPDQLTTIANLMSAHPQFVSELQERAR